MLNRRTGLPVTITKPTPPHRAKIYWEMLAKCERVLVDLIMTDESVYNGITENSTEIEKLSAAISFIYSHSGYALDYDKLHIEVSKAIIFNRKILETGFVTNYDRGLEDKPFLHITDDGKVMIAEHGSYLNYIFQKSAEDSSRYELELKIQELDIKLKESQLKVNTLQIKDIPKNAEDRKTIIFWQIATAVCITVAFLLKLFGVKGWI